MAVSETRVRDEASGATLVTTRLTDGSTRVRIEYSRTSLMKAAESPLSLLPPPALKTMVLETPEILAPFPTRHGLVEHPL